MKKILLFSSSDIFISRFLKDILCKLSTNYDLTIISNLKNNYLNNRIYKLIHLPISRKPKFFKDLIILFRIFFILKNKNPDLVITCTPKTQFYFLFLNFFFDFKRIHVYTGIYWQNFFSFKRKIYQSIDKINFKFSYKIFFDSRYQISIFKDLGIDDNKLQLISNGSIKGVNLCKYKPDELFYKRYRAISEIDNSAIIILYIGRFSPEKGLDILLKAFFKLIDNNNSVFLKFVGNDEYDFNLKIEKIHPKYKQYIKVYSETSKPHNFYKISDILCLPSRREGFGLCAIEGSASGLPVVSSDINGFSESVVDNLTGLKFKDGDHLQLYEILKKLSDNRKLIRILGKNGYNFAKKFDSKTVVNDFYNQIMSCIEENV